MAIKNGKFLKELKQWTTPAKGVGITLGKTLYRGAKLAWRHPYLTLAASLTHGAKRGRWKKRRAWFDTPLAGQKLKSKGKWNL